MTPARPVVTPRAGGAPSPDVMPLRLAHRAMRGDLARFTQQALDVAAGRLPATGRRAAATKEYLDLLCDSIHHHHRAEDDVLWPVIEASAGPHVDLTDLTDDHSQLDPKLEAVRAAAGALVAAPSSEDAASHLAHVLAEVRDLLDEHIEDEERTVFPVIERYVSVEDWARVFNRPYQRRLKTIFTP